MYHQESPLYTWPCHCRRYHSSLTHQTPAECSEYWLACPVCASWSPSERSGLQWSCCVRREAWSKAEGRLQNSTYWCLRGNQERNHKCTRAIFSCLSVPNMTNRGHAYNYSPMLKICTSCRVPIVLQPPLTKILLSETGSAAWNLSMYRPEGFTIIVVKQIWEL